MGRGSWITDPGFMCVMGFGCYNGGDVTCGGGGYGGLWLLQWWLWQVEWWWTRGLAACYSFAWSCFIIILMSSLYYLNKMVTNIKGLILSGL